MNNLTNAQKLKLVTNAILTDYPKESVLRITKEVKKTHIPHGIGKVTETRINVRVEKPTGKKATRKVMVYEHEGKNLVNLDTSYNRHTIGSLLSM